MTSATSDDPALRMTAGLRARVDVYHLSEVLLNGERGAENISGQGVRASP